MTIKTVKNSDSNLSEKYTKLHPHRSLLNLKLMESQVKLI